MTWVATAVVAATTIGSAVLGGNASSRAADQQSQAAQQGQQLLQQNYEKLSPYYTPYINVGQQGVNQLSSMMPYMTQQFQTYKPATMADIKAMMPANYEFMKQQGLGAVRQASNVGGGGSNTTRAATKFAEDYASNAYQTALNNYMTQQNQQFGQQQAQRSNIYNTLAGISNIGAQGVANLGNLATGTAQNVAGLGIQSANAQAAGTIGEAKAYSTGLSNLGNIFGSFA